MGLLRISRRFFTALILILSLGQPPAAAQPVKQNYEPQVGQEGKDVVWVPTPESLVEKMLDMAKVTAKDYVIDLGSGDGRTVIAAAKRGARAHGIEYNADMVSLAQRNAAREGVSARATFAKADLFESDFSKATVLTLFLLPEINLKLRPKILNLRPGTRVVSNSFDMEDWKADQTVMASENCTSWCEAYLWIVPAKVQGTWKLADGELTIKQSFQTVHGTLKTADGTTKISNGKLNGEQITFNAGRTRYTGRVSGDEIHGKVGGGSWRATRVGQ
jgi:hypothetical protein